MTATTKLVVAMAAALLLSGTAGAQPYKGVAFAGGTAGDGLSGYAGVVYALPGAQLGRGFAIRGSGNAGGYEYESSGGDIDAKFVGGEIALVYQLSGAWGWANFSAGPRVTNLSLSPDDASNGREGTRLDAGLQSDGALLLDRSWRLSWIGSVAVRDRAYYSRMSLDRMVDRESGTRIGAEAGLQGDPRYRRTSAGVFAATRLSRNLEGQVSVGAHDQERREARPYVTAGLTVLF